MKFIQMKNKVVLFILLSAVFLFVVLFPVSNLPQPQEHTCFFLSLNHKLNVTSCSVPPVKFNVVVKNTAARILLFSTLLLVLFVLLHLIFVKFINNKSPPALSWLPYLLFNKDENEKIFTNSYFWLAIRNFGFRARDS
jgi:hypothetical protein